MSTSSETAAQARPPRVPGFETGRFLGFGGSGEVWAATASGSGAPVALKVLRPAADPQAARRESALMRRLDHPHVVRLIDVVDTGGGLVLVLERASGGSLAALVGARGPLDPGEVVTVLTPLAQALADLHARGLVHGDVSAGNVLFADDGRPLLADLGVSSLLGLPADAHGTPGFTDAAALPAPAGDVYALAAVGWFALTGQVPPPADLRPPLIAAAPGTPAPLADLVEAGLAAHPGQRPGAAAFAARAFGAVAASPVRLVPTDPAAVAAEVVTHRLRGQISRSRPAGSAHRGERGRRRSCWPPRWGSLAWRRLGSGGRGSRRLGSARPGSQEPGLQEPRSGEPGSGEPELQEPGSRQRRAVAVLAPLVAVALVAVALLVVAGALVVPRTSSGPASVSEPAPSGPVASEPIAPAQGERPSPAAPSEADPAPGGADPASAIAPISRLRAEAFATGRAGPLLEASAPGSPALAADLRLLADLTQQGLVLGGLAFEVDDVEVLDARAGEAHVRVVVTTGEHRRLRSADAVVLAEVPKSGPVTSELRLRVVDGAWRVAEVVSGPEAVPGS